VSQRINVRGIIFKEGQIFAQVLKKPTGESTFWCTPGGGLELGESLHEGLNREIIEETGVTPEIGKLLFIQQFNDDQGEQLELFFHIKNADDYQTINLAQTTHGDMEINRCSFVDPTSVNLLPDFLQETDIAAYIETEKPVLLLDYLN
jgi:ADP-ribose pyrophosphatase YjhB (NUDIX family)